MANSRRNVGESTQSAESLQGNPAYDEAFAKAMAALVPENAREVHLTFPPYWKPEINTGFRGTVLYRDERDPTFARYIIESAVTLDCRRGPVDDGEIITIQPGMNFSIGVYASLPLERFFGLELTAIAVGKQKLPVNKTREIPYDMWQFRTFLVPEVEKRINSNRAEDIRFLQDAQRNAHRLMLKELASAQVAVIGNEKQQQESRRRAMNSIL